MWDAGDPYDLYLVLAGGVLLVDRRDDRVVLVNQQSATRRNFHHATGLDHPLRLPPRGTSNAVCGARNRLSPGRSVVRRSGGDRLDQVTDPVFGQVLRDIGLRGRRRVARTGVGPQFVTCTANA